MKKKSYKVILGVAIFVGIMVSACRRPKEDTEISSQITDKPSVPITLEVTNEPSVSIMPEETEEPSMSITPEVTEEPYISMKGDYNLEECDEENGIFIAYEDGSFDKYYHGGYCLGLTQGVTAFEGMFMADCYVENLPVISNVDDLVLFWDVKYYVSVFPIHGEVATIQVLDENGNAGFGKLNSSNKSMDLYYRNHDSSCVNIQMINGNDATEYQSEKIGETVKPFKGMSSVTQRWELNGFKNEECVTLGTINGTQLLEQTYKIDSKYYACDPQMNNWDEEDVYYPNTVATVYGYAKLDFSEIPSGHYVMVVRGANSKYIATILDWENE